MTFTPGSELNEDDLTQEDIDEYNKRRKEEYDDANNPKDPNDLEEELKKRNQPDPSQGVAAPDYTLDSMLYSIVAPKLPDNIGSVGVLLNQLRKKITNPSTVLQLQDDEQPLLNEQLDLPPVTDGPTSSILELYGGSVSPKIKEILAGITAKIKGESDETGIEGDKFNYGTDVLGNVDAKTQKLLRDNGFTKNQSVLLVSNFDKPFDRNLMATIQSIANTNKDFDSFKQEMLPVYLQSMKKLRRTKTPQADHIAQLRASLPFFYGKPVELWPEISDIIISEGIFGLGHNKKNLTFLEFPVHTVKTAFWKEQVGDAGEKFFAGRPLDTPDQIRAAAKEYAKFIKKSNKIVNNATDQYELMNDESMNPELLEEYISRLGVDPLESKYSIKQVKDILKQMEDDGFKVTSKTTQAEEAKTIKSEQKTAKDKKARQAKIDQEFQKSVVESETYRKYYASDEGKFKSPLVKGSKDDMLITHAEDIYEEMSVDKNPDTKDAMIKKIMKIIKPRYKG